MTLSVDHPAKKMVFVLNSWWIPPIYIILYHFVDQKSWSRKWSVQTKDTWIWLNMWVHWPPLLRNPIGIMGPVMDSQHLHWKPTRGERSHHLSYIASTSDHRTWGCISLGYIHGCIYIYMYTICIIYICNLYVCIYTYICIQILNIYIWIII